MPYSSATIREFADGPVFQRKLLGERLRKAALCLSLAGWPVWKRLLAASVFPGIVVVADRHLRTKNHINPTGGSALSG